MNRAACLALVLGAFVATAGAARAQSFEGRFDLRTRSSTGQVSSASLVIARSGSGFEVTRTTGGKTWRSSVVRVQARRMDVCFRVAATPASSIGIAGSLTPGSHDAFLAELGSTNVFDAVYVLSTDGKKIQETVVNRTRLKPDHGWAWLKSEGTRPAPPAAPALKPAELEKLVRKHIEAWYREDVIETYKSLLEEATTEAERTRLRAQRKEDLDAAADLSIESDATFLQELKDEIEDGSPIRDRNGNAVPAWAIAARSVSFFPNYAGIGLSKSFAFDRRTGELLRETDIMD